MVSVILNRSNFSAILKKIIQKTQLNIKSFSPNLFKTLLIHFPDKSGTSSFLSSDSKFIVLFPYSFRKIMLLLFESASGYGLFKVNNGSEISEVDDVQKVLGSCSSEQASKYLSLQKFQPIRDTAEALQCATALVESKISKPLKKLLKKVDSSEELMVADAKLGQLIKEKFSIQCVFNKRTEELMRVVREHLTELASNSITTDEATGMALGLAHSLSRYKLKFSPDKVDTMIVQAISLLDDLDKELNNMMMRMREWYNTIKKMYLKD